MNHHAQCAFQIRPESEQTVMFVCHQEALQGPGKVLIHCSQGVSRSTTLLIAFLMWRSDHAYDEVFQHVKAKRGVANPNIGFICQVWLSVTKCVHHTSTCIMCIIAYCKAYATLLTTWEDSCNGMDNPIRAFQPTCIIQAHQVHCVLYKHTKYIAYYTSTPSTLQLCHSTHIVCMGACSLGAATMLLAPYCSNPQATETDSLLPIE